MRELAVWLGHKQIGVIQEGRKGGRFSYLPQIVEEMPGVPLLSLCLPVKAKPFSEAKTAAWFEGLLPEGVRRQEVARSLGLSEYDWIGLLAEIGWECAGAVRIYEATSAPATPDALAATSAPATPAHAHQTSYTPLSPEELAVKLSDIASRMPQTTTGLFRMSLGGFQEKMCVAMPPLTPGQRHIDNPNVSLPVGDAPSTHILKPENTRDYPGCAESEAWAMTVASCAAKCAKVALLRLDGCPDTLVVERYDRIGNMVCAGSIPPAAHSGYSSFTPPAALATRTSLTPHTPFSSSSEIVRIHQEDACQALGLPSNRKYADERIPKGDSPTYRAMADLLEHYAADQLAEKKELLKQMTVNVALGNWDAHAKNTSFLYANDGTPTVSPMYDVLPIVDVEQRITLLSLRIAGTRDPARITGKSLVEEACSWGMSANEAQQTVEECLSNLLEGLKEAREAYPAAAERHESGVLARVKHMD